MATVAVIVFIITGFSLYLYSVKKASQWNIPDSNIEVSGEIISENEITVNLSLHILRPIKEEYGETSGGLLTWSEYEYTKVDITISGNGMNTQSISKNIDKGYNYMIDLLLSTQIPNFLFEDKDSYILHLDLFYSAPSWICTKTKFSSGWEEYGNCITPAQSAYRSSDSWDIMIKKENITNPKGIYKIYEKPFSQIYDLQLNYREDDVLLTFRTEENLKSLLYKNSFGEYIYYKDISKEPQTYHEISLPLENARYKVEVSKTVDNNFYSKIHYTDYKEFEITAPEPPKLSINITKYSITGSKLEVRFKIENETDKTEKHFFYREIGHGIIEPKLNKLGDEYGVELSLQNGTYEYWIYAKDGDQEVTTDKVQFTINVEEGGIKFTKTNEKIGTTTYGLSFKLNERLDDVSYKYKKKDDPVSELKEGHIPRFGYEYNFSLSNLTPDMVYELDVFAGNEKVYSTVFRTKFTQEDLPQTTPPSDETNGISVNSFFVIIAIIAGLFYYVYTQIKKGGKKR